MTLCHVPDDDDPRCTALDAVRGLARLAYRHGETLLCEVPLPNGRRADALAIDLRGQIVIYEVKVARADLLADSKWTEYLPWCDRFCWVIAPTIDPALLNQADRMPDRCGVIVADRYDAVMIRQPATVSLAPARRSAETRRIARLAMARMMRANDPDYAAYALEGEPNR